MTTILFGIVPAVVALGVIVVSIRSIVRAFSLVQLAVGIPAGTGFEFYRGVGTS